MLLFDVKALKQHVIITMLNISKGKKKERTRHEVL